MARRARSPKRMSKVIGFRAFFDTDRDLLEWWEGLPAGDRSNVLRELIRTGLQNGVGRFNPATIRYSDFSQLCADTAWIRDALVDLPRYVEQVIQQIASFQPVSMVLGNNGESRASPRLDESNAQRRENRMRQSRW